jgi:hypothetical protein
MSFEIIEHENVLFAEIIRSDAKSDITQFYSASNNSFQFGLLANTEGYIEEPHYHHPVQRTIKDLSQMFVVQKGVVAVDFYDSNGREFRSVTLERGDAIVLVNGAHRIRVLEDMQCISVKQGPFLGDEKDKVIIDEYDSSI